MFACGPPPMLEAVRALCAERGVPAQLALESGMACGFGACFGCVVPTRDGYLRLCVDGPVLDADRLDTALVPGAGTTDGPLRRASSRGPVLNGSGTFDAIAARRAFGDALLERFPFHAFVSKTITLEPRQGNPPPRLWETPAGHDQLDRAAQQGPGGLPGPRPARAGRAAGAAGGVGDGVQPRRAGRRSWSASAARDEVAMIELNVSCPNVESGLRDGRGPGRDGAAVERVRPLTERPLIVKLTPNATDPAAVAAAAEEAGADAVSLINTLKGMALDPRGPAARGSAAAPAASRAPRCARSPWSRCSSVAAAGRDTRDRHGRASPRGATRPISSPPERDLRGGRHRELPRPGRRPPDRRRVGRTGDLAAGRLTRRGRAVTHPGEPTAVFP